MPELSLERSLLFVLALLLVVQTGRLLWVRGLAARRMDRNRRLGASGERTAEHLLLARGFEIIERQTSGGYHFWVDGKRIAVNLRADFVVRRGHRVLLVEVKGGDESAKPTVRATRRQLLEYTMAFRIDGILLLDAASHRISEIRFPDRHDRA